MTQTEKRMLTLLLEEYEDQKLGAANAYSAGDWRGRELKANADAARKIIDDLK